MNGDEKLKLAKVAILRLLNAIADDPRKFWLLGDGTESWARLTEAAAAIWDKPVEKIREEFRPKTHEFDRYCAEKESAERLLAYCRENGITGT